MKLYERVQKSNTCIYGSKLIEEATNPFLEGPCLLCIAPAMIIDKSVFGITKEGMNLARLRVRESENARFGINDFPVKFLSVKAEKAEESNLNPEEQLQELINKYFIPLVSNGDKKIDVSIAMRNMRNVNIMSYCDATITVQNIEDSILEKMHQLGYTEEECNMIQSQMFMLPIATNVLEGKQKSTCISFRDINDEELFNPEEDQLAEEIEKTSIKERSIKKSNTELEYLIFGEGNHELKMYGKSGKAFQVCMSSVLTNALENSIKNSQKETEFMPINIEELTRDFESIMKDAEKGIDTSILMKKIDEKLNYGNAKRLTDYEIQLLEQVDEFCDSKRKLQQELSYTQTLYERDKICLEKTNKAIKEICSEDIQKKLLSVQGYQFREDDEHTKKAERLQQSVQELKKLDAEIEKSNQQSKEK